MKIFNLLLLISLLSCSKLTEKISDQDNSVLLVANLIKKKSCNFEKTQLLISDSSSLNYYDSFFKNKSFAELSTIEKATILFFSEFYRRPDLSSLQSQIQLIEITNNEVQYYDFNSSKLPENQRALYTFDYLLQKNKLKSISQLFELFISIIPHQIPVDEGFEQFVKENKAQIYDNSTLSKFWLKGDEPITRFETFSSEYDFGNIKKYKRPDLSLLAFNTLDFHENKDFSSINCNFDFNSEKDNLYIDKAENDLINYIAIKEVNKTVILISSSIKHDQFISKTDTILKVKQKSPPIPICIFKNKNQNSLVVATSINGRSKSQHLKHLIDYEIYNSTDFSQVNEILNFSRHLFLNSPDRILYESKRGRKDQLEFFLSMNFPIYHADKIGNIIGLSCFGTNCNLINDDRNNSELKCKK
jgi:hypothetical protein